MSHLLIDRHGVTVGRFAGPGGVPTIQVSVSDDQGQVTYAVMTLREFDRWLADLLREMNRVALESGDPPDPRTIAAMRRGAVSRMRCSLCHQDLELIKPYETSDVVVARRRLTDAMHAMHVDQRIRVDLAAARELDAAWDAYDAAVLDGANRAVSQ